MRSGIVPLIGIGLICSIATAQAPTGSAFPKRVLDLKKPADPPATFNGKSLKMFEADDLSRAARQFGEDKEYDTAVTLQSWAVKKSDSGRYDLACFCALAGRKEDAFYWLQEAALLDGADPDWANQDTDLTILRADNRWDRIDGFLRACGDAWKKSNLIKTELIVPKGYRPGTPIGVIVGMHGRGATPTGFVDGDYQEFADRLKMAIVAISGPIPYGKDSFHWSEEPKRDSEHIQKVLAGLSSKLTVKKGEIVLFGFSQGAQMAFEVAFQNPDLYRGALVMSPGTTKFFINVGLKPSEKNKEQGYVLLCGEQEAPGNVKSTTDDKAFAERAGARVRMILAPDQERHSFPKDYYQQFESRIRFILGGPGAK